VARPERGKSLQDVLRERRGAKALLTVEQLRRRELERERAETESAARAAVESWRATGRAVDAAGRLPVAVYREILALDAAAYELSRHWAGRERAQRTSAPACEVSRCGESADLRVLLVERAAVGQERPGRDLLTLCGGCERRARRLERERGRLPGREELVALDPAEPLYDAARIARLKSRYARPLRRKDLRA
jgi:hypothetical protein